MNGTITVIDAGAVRVHSYRAPADSVHVTTQLIETPGRVIAIDAQFLTRYADEAAAYARQRICGMPADPNPLFTPRRAPRRSHGLAVGHPAAAGALCHRWAVRCAASTRV
jgi:hypothetical protein